ncbi:MAG: hypothetical protein ACLP19_05265 [Xanthobacteraceae bacterium]
MLSRTFGRIEIPPKTARRDQQIERLHSENNRLKAALRMREVEIKRLRSQLKEKQETST